MKSGAEGWIALDEASSAFERPSWAIRAMLDQGKLERKIERGQVYVRVPPAPSASNVSSGKTAIDGRRPTDASPAVDGSRPDASPAIDRPDASPAVDGGRPDASLAVGGRSSDTPASSEPTLAAEPTLADLANELEATLEPLVEPTPAPAALVPVASPSPANDRPNALARDLPQERTTVVVPADAALWSEVAANLAELAHAARARDALLARTAQALRAVEAATARAPQPIERPAPARFPWALASVLGILAVATCVFARLESRDAGSSRVEAELALRRAARLEARAHQREAETAALALTLATGLTQPLGRAVAPTTSSATLAATTAAIESARSVPAGFAK